MAKSSMGLSTNRAVIFFNSNKKDKLSEQEFKILKETLRDDIVLLQSGMSLWYEEDVGRAVNHCYKVFAFVSMMSRKGEVDELFQSLCRRSIYCENHGFSSYEYYIIPYTKEKIDNYTIRNFYHVLEGVYKRTGYPKNIHVACNKNVFYGDANSNDCWYNCARTINSYLSRDKYFKNDSNFENLRKEYEYYKER